MESIVQKETTPIAETNHFIILDNYTKIDQSGAGYQTEKDLENQTLCPSRT